MDFDSVELSDPSHLSPSSLGTFLRCPRQYRLRYIDRAEPAFRAAELAFGSAFYAAFQAWLASIADGRVLTEEEVRERFKVELHAELHAPGPPILWKDSEANEERFEALGEKMLAVLLTKFAAPDRVLGVEVPFELWLTEPESERELPPVVGAFDALVEYDGRVHLLELKTAARRWGEDQLRDDLQLTTYARAIEERAANAELTLVVALKTRESAIQVERVTRNAGDQRDLLDTVASVSRAVRAGVDHPVRSWQCRTCPFLGGCR